MSWDSWGSSGSSGGFGSGWGSGSSSSTSGWGSSSSGGSGGSGGWGSSSGGSSGNSGWGSSSGSSGGWGSSSSSGGWGSSSSSSGGGWGSSSSSAPSVGTKGYQFRPFVEKITDPKTRGTTELVYQNICMNKEFSSKSPEELRFEDLFGKAAAASTQASSSGWGSSGTSGWGSGGGSSTSSGWGSSSSSTGSGWGSSSNDSSFGSGWGSSSGGGWGSSDNNKSKNDGWGSSSSSGGGWGSSGGSSSTGWGSGSSGWGSSSSGSSGWGSTGSSSTGWGTSDKKNDSGWGSSSSSGSGWGSSGSSGGGWGSSSQSNKSGNSGGWGSSSSSSSSGWGSGSSGSSSKDSGSGWGSWGSSSGSSSSGSSSGWGGGWGSDSKKDSSSGGSSGGWGSGWGSSSSSKNDSGWGSSGSSGGWGSGWGSSSSSSSNKKESSGWGGGWGSDWGSSSSKSKENKKEEAPPMFAAFNLNPFQIDLTLGLKALNDPKKLAELTRGATQGAMSSTTKTTTMKPLSSREKYNLAQWTTSVGPRLPPTVVRVAPRFQSMARSPTHSTTIPSDMLSLVRSQQRSAQRASAVGRTLSAIVSTPAIGGDFSVPPSTRYSTSSKRRSRMPGASTMTSGPSGLDASEIEALHNIHIDVKPLNFKSKPAVPETKKSNDESIVRDSAIPVGTPVDPRSKSGTLLSSFKDSKRERDFVNPFPILTKHKYFTIPAMQELQEMTEEELSRVEDFVVGHEDYGELQWPGITDVRGLDLNKLVNFKRHMVQVYDDALIGTLDEHGQPYAKPPRGCELNKHTVVALVGLWPGQVDSDDSSTMTEEERVNKFAREIASSVECKEGMEFLSYSVKEGELRFSVEHWTVYGVLPQKGSPPKISRFDSMPSDDGEKENTQKTRNQSSKVDFSEFARSKAKPRRSTTQASGDQDSDPFEYRSSFDDQKLVAPEPDNDADGGQDLDEEVKVVVPTEEESEDDTLDIPEERVLFAQGSGMAVEKPGNELDDFLLYRETRDTQMAHSRHNAFLSGIALFDCSHRSGEGLIGRLTRVEPTTLKSVLGCKLYVKLLHDLMAVHFALYQSHDCTDVNLFRLPSEIECAGSWLAKSPLDRLHIALTKYIAVLDSILMQYLIANETSEAEAVCDADIGYQILSNMIKSLKLASVLFALPYGANEQSVLAVPYDEDHMHIADGSVPFSETFARRRALITWLESVVQPSINARITKAQKRLTEMMKKSQQSDMVSIENTQCCVVYLFLLANRTNDAILQAMEFGNYRLTTLLSQTHGRDYIRKQIEEWKKDGSWDQFSEYRRKIYLLISGDYSQITRQGHLTWEQCLLIVLVYSSSDCEPLTEVITRFIRDYGADLEWVTAPLLALDLADTDAAKPFDLCFDFLRLKAGLMTAEEFSDPGKSPLLNPLNYQSTNLECSLNWLMQDLLFDAGILRGYLPPNHRINEQWVTQLESAGLWQWAVYAAIHAYHRCRRIPNAHPICNPLANSVFRKHVKDSVLTLVCDDDSSETEDITNTDRRSVIFQAVVEFDSRTDNRISEIWKSNEKLLCGMEEIIGFLELEKETLNAINVCLAVGLPLPSVLHAYSIALINEGHNVSAVNLALKGGRMFQKIAVCLGNVGSDHSMAAIYEAAREEALRLAAQLWRRMGEVYCYQILPTSVFQSFGNTAHKEGVQNILDVLNHLSKRKQFMQPFWDRVSGVYQGYYQTMALKQRIEEILEEEHTADEKFQRSLILMQRKLDSIIASSADYSYHFH